MIHALRDEAGVAGDDAMVATCSAALDGHYGPRADCADAITAARAADDSVAFVNVVEGKEDLVWEAEHEDEKREAAYEPLPY